MEEPEPFEEPGACPSAEFAPHIGGGKLPGIAEEPLPHDAARCRNQGFASSLVEPQNDFRERRMDEKSFSDTAFAKSAHEQFGLQLTDYCPQIITTGEPPYRVIDVNDLWLDVCGFRRDDVMGDTLRIVQGEFTDRENRLRPMMDCVRKRERVETEFINYTGKGEPFVNCITIDPISAGPVDLFMATTVSVDKFSPHEPPTSFDSIPQGTRQVPVILMFPPKPGECVRYPAPVMAEMRTKGMPRSLSLANNHRRGRRAAFNMDAGQFAAVAEAAARAHETGQAQFIGPLAVGVEVEELPPDEVVGA